MSSPEGARLQLRWEIFNLLNGANFDRRTWSRSRRISAASFTRPPRQMQFGVRLLF
jgi:hypothetical protein